MLARKLAITIIGLHYSPEPTGNAPYTTSLAEGLVKRGHKVTVITSHPHYPEWQIREGYGGWATDETLEGVRVRRLAHYVPAHPSSIKRLLSEVSFGLRAATTSWGRPDVVLLVSPALFSSVIVRMKMRLQLNSPPVGLWIQDIYSLGVTETDAGGRKVARFMQAIESWTLRGASGVAVIHDRFKDYVESDLSVKSSSIEVIRNWSHLPARPMVDRAYVRSRLGWSEEEVIVLHAGNIGAKQGLENVVEAARFADSQEIKVRFILLGDGNQRARLEALAAGITRIQFMDPVPGDEFQEALTAADVLLVNERPGVSDMAVPSKLTSYFTSGTPVLGATDAGSVTASELRASGAGQRVDAGDPVSLVRSAMTLADDPNAREVFGAAGRDFCASRLSEHAAIDRYARWLTMLAAKRVRRRRISTSIRKGTL